MRIIHNHNIRKLHKLAVDTAAARMEETRNQYFAAVTQPPSVQGIDRVDAFEEYEEAMWTFFKLNDQYEQMQGLKFLFRKVQ